MLRQWWCVDMIILKLICEGPYHRRWPWIAWSLSGFRAFEDKVGWSNAGATVELHPVYGVLVVLYQKYIHRNAFNIIVQSVIGQVRVTRHEQYTWSYATKTWDKRNKFLLRKWGTSMAQHCPAKVDSLLSAGHWVYVWVLILQAISTPFVGPWRAVPSDCSCSYSLVVESNI